MKPALIKLAAVLMMVAMVAGAWGCAKATGSAAKQNLAYYATNAEPVLDWDPSVEFSNGIIVMNNIYETLLRYIPSTDSFQPILATEYSHSDDGLTWNFKLRQGVKFHDGTTMNAEAVKFSFERTMQLKQGAYYIWDCVDSINVVNDYEVQFKLKYKAPLDIVVSAGYAAFVMSPTAVKNNAADWLSKGNEAGTGPYTLKSFKMGEEVVLQAFKDYWGGWKDNQYTTVYFKKVPEFASRRQMVEKGEATVIFGISPEDHKALAKNANLVVDTEPSFQNLLLFFNTKKEPLNNPVVRQALSYAFPYQDVAEYALGGEAVQSRGFIPTGLWGHGKDLLQYTHDMDKAKQLLTQAGYGDGGLTLSLTYMSGDEGEKRTMELYQSELAKLNIKLDLRAMPWDSQWELAKSPDPKNAQDIFAMYWWPDLASPYSWLFNLFHSEDQPLYNMSYYSNPDYDKLIDDANVASGTDRAKGEQMFIDAQKLLMQDAPSIPAYDVEATKVYQKSFMGFKDNPAYPNVIFFYDTYKG